MRTAITGEVVSGQVNTEKKSQCILVVDDHPKVLRFIEIDLKLHGFEVITATSGEEALRLVELAKPDIMLLDIIMPGMSGFEVLRRLRSFTHLPVIAFSASPGERDGVLRLGANDFVAKPFSSEELAMRIKVLLNPSLSILQ